MKMLWDVNKCWYLQNCEGRISYVDCSPSSAMPIIPDIQMPDGTFAAGDSSVWIPMTPGRGKRPFRLPDRPHVYPAPGYLRLVYRAHCRGGIEDNFLDTTLLMDRQTTLRAYLDGNPLLRDWVTDPIKYSDRVCDRYG